MSITVHYGHLARGLEIVSVAIPMASSFSIYLYNVLNSQFRLLPILRCTCGGQFGNRLRQSVRHFLPPVPVKISLVHGDAGQNGVSYPKRVPGVRERHWNLKSPLIVQVSNAGYTLAQDIYVAAWYASGS